MEAPPAPGTHRESGFRFIDLFAGIGGLRRPFEEIGGRCVFTSEWDRCRKQTYSANFPFGDRHQFVGDIRPYSALPEMIPELSASARLAGRYAGDFVNHRARR